VQKEMIAGGKVNLVDDQALFNTASELTKIMGYKNPDKFFNDPSAKDPQTGQPMHPPPQPPVPESVQVAQIKAQTDKELNAQKAEIEKLQAEADIITQRMKTEADIALAREKFQLEARIKLMEADIKQQEMADKMAAQTQAHEYKIAEAEMGLVTTAADHDMKSRQGQETHEQKLELADKAAKAKPKGSGK
jgi:hypothetical protein